MSKIYVEALYDYVPEKEREKDEFPFKVGDLIEVFNQDDEGWWEGQVCQDGDGVKGFFPSTYVKKTERRPASIAVKPAAPPPAAAAKKPKEQKSGGGRARKPQGPKNSATRYGVWATVAVKYVSMFNIIAGVGLLSWGMFGAGDGLNPPLAPYVGSPVYLRLWGFGEVLMAFYSITIGVLVFLYEHHGPIMGHTLTCCPNFRGMGAARGIYNEGQKDAVAKPSYIKGLLYLVLSLPGYLTLLTLLGSALMLLPVSLNFVSGHYNEIYIPPKPRGGRGKKKEDEEYDQESLSYRIFEYIAGQNPEGQMGRFICMIIYVALNFWTGISAVIDANEAGVQDTFTYWIHMAKFFGYIMDLNFSMLLIPVSRTLIRGIYNCATRETVSCKAKCFLCILRYIPLDEAFQIHKLLARVGFFAAVMHTISHVFNFGLRADAVDLKFGLNIWVTGVGLILVMLFIFSCAHDSVKKFHFELFWGTHWLWPLFFFLITTHGCAGPETPRERCWFGPHYWYWLIGPGSLFLIERVIRECLSRQPACLLAFTQMGNPGTKDTTVLSLSLQKIGAFGTEYREGQYSYLMCPPISNFEWHPFTISSCPQQDDVTFHIRILKGGWTEALLHHLQLYAKSTEPLTVLSHNVTGLQGMEKKPGRLVTADGIKLLRVYGPHSAPTQHLTKYGEVYIVTSGIGVTPLNSCMKSVVLHRWKFASGLVQPSRVHFFWVSQHAEIERFRWFVRTVKDVCDTLSDLLEKSSKTDQDDPKLKKMFSFHVFLTRINDDVKKTQNEQLEQFIADSSEPKRLWKEEQKKYDAARNRVEVARAQGGNGVKAVEEDFKAQEVKMELASQKYETLYQRFWGAKPRDEKGLKTGHARFTEEEFYKQLCDASKDGGEQVFKVSKPEFDDVAVIKIIPGRPKWEPFFDETNKSTPYEDVGVCFCGNPFIGKLLEQNCSKFTKQNKRTRKKLTWHLHQEVF